MCVIGTLYEKTYRVMYATDYLYWCFGRLAATPKPSLVTSCQGKDLTHNVQLYSIVDWRVFVLVFWEDGHHAKDNLVTCCKTN